MVQRKYCDNIVFKVFLLSRFHLMFLPSTLASLPPGVMLLNCSVAPRDSATDIEKISQKGAPEGEQPNRSVIKTVIFNYSPSKSRVCTVNVV